MEFPKILAINLIERKDRWKTLQEEFQDWPEPLHRISAIRRTVGWQGCTLSHQKAIRYAKKKHLPWVLILEDDCHLEKDALQRFQELLPVLWERRAEWDIFTGGFSHCSGSSRVIQDSPPILRAKGRTTHFCLLNEAIYDTILNMKMDVIDMYYEKNFRMWVTIPYLAIQHASHSNIEKKHVNYGSIFTKSGRTLKKVLSKWRKTQKHR
jgi:hypothetical protein